MCMPLEARSREFSCEFVACENESGSAFVVQQLRITHDTNAWIDICKAWITCRTDERGANLFRQSQHACTAGQVSIPSSIVSGDPLHRLVVADSYLDVTQRRLLEAAIRRARIRLSMGPCVSASIEMETRTHLAMGLCPCLLGCRAMH